MRRTFIFSVLTLAFMTICQSAFAFDYYVNGIYYRKATQQLPGGGCGETYLIVVNDDYPNTYSGDMVVPETEIINGETLRVRYIGSEAFYGCVNLTSVTLPNTIVNIGYHSFADCHLLPSAIVMSSTTSLFITTSLSSFGMMPLLTSTTMCAS